MHVTTADCFFFLTLTKGTYFCRCQSRYLCLLHFRPLFCCFSAIHSTYPQCVSTAKQSVPKQKVSSRFRTRTLFSVEAAPCAVLSFIMIVCVCGGCVGSFVSMTMTMAMTVWLSQAAPPPKQRGQKQAEQGCLSASKSHILIIQVHLHLFAIQIYNSSITNKV